MAVWVHVLCSLDADAIFACTQINCNDGIAMHSGHQYFAVAHEDVEYVIFTSGDHGVDKASEV